jgi:hypothetical protein
VPIQYHIFLQIRVSAPCARCTQTFDDLEAYKAHLEGCSRTCQFGCRKGIFFSAHNAKRHEAKRNCCERARKRYTSLAQTKT